MVPMLPNILDSYAMRIDWLIIIALRMQDVHNKSTN